MKNSKLKGTSIIGAIILFALIMGCNSGKKDQNNTEKAASTEMADDDMPQQENEAVTVDIKEEPSFIISYMNIKNALVNDDYEQVKKTASDMLNSLESSVLNEEQRNQLKESINQLVVSPDIKAQRKQFGKLSQQLYTIAQKTDFTSKPLYWQHCPMAINNQGANWLSFKEKVENPYLGQYMLNCGSVEEIIK